MTLSPEICYPPPAWLRFADALRYASLTKHQLRPLLQTGEATFSEVRFHDPAISVTSKKIKRVQKPGKAK